MPKPLSAGRVLLLALGLTAATLLAACPAKDQTASAPGGSAARGQQHAAGSASQDDASAAGVYPEGWPLAAVTLPPGAAPAALPDSVARAYQEPGVLTADGSGMHKAMPDMKADYWYLGFASALGPRELLAHFDACARAAGLAGDPGNTAAPGLSANYAAADGSSGLSIQPAPDKPGEYFIFLQQRRAE